MIEKNHAHVSTVVLICPVQCKLKGAKKEFGVHPAEFFTRYLACLYMDILFSVEKKKRGVVSRSLKASVNTHANTHTEAHL